MAKKKKIILSAALAVYNEECNLDACLASVAPWVDEIVVVDGGSADGTLDIAKQYGAHIIRTDNPPIFHINKQKALDACLGEWILQLDADEVVTSELKDQILDTVTQKDAKDAYYIPRKNYFLGHWLSKGGQYPDYVIRLFKNGNGKFPCESVHEQIEVSGEVGHLTKPLTHYTSRTIREYWRKADSYTTLTAGEYKKDNVGKNPWTAMRYMVYMPVRTFFLLFFRHKGCIDGYWGFLFALFSGLHHAIAYRKYVTST